MKTTGIASLALVATAAAFISTADAHGQMTFPTNRNITAKFRKDGGTLGQAGDEELQYSPLELLSQRKQKDFPEAKTFTVMNGCRGTVYESTSPVTRLAPGAEFDVKWYIQAPHPGTMKLSIVKPDDSSGKIMYKSYKTLLNVDSFANNAGEGSTKAKMPTDVQGCGQPGNCAVQMYWHSDIANQTYVTCGDIVVSGSGGGSTPSTSTTTTESSGNGGTSTATEAPSSNSTPSTPSSNSTPSTPSSNSTPSTPSSNSTPSTPSSNSTPSTPSSNQSPSTPTTTTTTAPSSQSTPTTDSSVGGEAEAAKCTRRRS